MSKKQTKKTETESIQRQLASVLVYAGVFTIFLVYLPLVHNGFQDIQDYKSYFINWVLGIMVGACVLIGLTWVIGHYKELTKENMKKWLKSVTPSGWFLTALLFAAVVSFLATSYKTESLWGLKGRRFGFCMLVLCVLSHILIERFLNHNQYILFGTIAECNGCKCDLYPEQYGYRCSTYVRRYGVAGKRIHFYDRKRQFSCRYVGSRFPISACSILLLQEKASLIIYGAFSVIAFMTMVAVESDSIFFAVGVTFCILFWFTINDYKQLRRLLILVAFFLVGSRLTGIITQSVKGAGSLFGGLPALLGYTNKGLLLLPLVLLCFACTFYLEKNSYGEKVQQVIKKIFAVVVILAVLGVVILFILVNQQETKELAIQKYHAFGSALFFDEMWGNWRGSNLRYTAELFGKSSFFHKLFGYGPGNFYFGLFDIFGGEVYINNLRMLDAHNDFLDFLINTGIVGAIGYYGFILYHLRKYWKLAKEDRTACTVVCLIAGYIVQGFVNNTLICVTPIFILLLAVERSSRREKK